MIEIEEAIIEVREGVAVLLVKIATLGECEPEWREVARCHGHGSVRVSFPDAWSEGTEITV